MSRLKITSRGCVRRTNIFESTYIMRFIYTLIMIKMVATDISPHPWSCTHRVHRRYLVLRSGIPWQHLTTFIRDELHHWLFPFRRILCFRLCWCKIPRNIAIICIVIHTPLNFLLRQDTRFCWPRVHLLNSLFLRRRICICLEYHFGANDAKFKTFQTAAARLQSRKWKCVA